MINIYLSGVFSTSQCLCLWLSIHMIIIIRMLMICTCNFKLIFDIIGIMGVVTFGTDNVIGCIVLGHFFGFTIYHMLVKGMEFMNTDHL